MNTKGALRKILSNLHPNTIPPLRCPPPPPQGASGQQLVGGVVGVQNRGVAPPRAPAPYKRSLGCGRSDTGMKTSSLLWLCSVGGLCSLKSCCFAGVSLRSPQPFLFGLRTAPGDHRPPTTNRTATATNRQPPAVGSQWRLVLGSGWLALGSWRSPTPNRQPPPNTDCQPPTATNHQPPTANL